MLEVCIIVKRSLFSCRLSPRQIPGGHYSRQKTTPFSRGCRNPAHTYPLVCRCAAACWSRPRGPRCALRLPAGFFARPRFPPLAPEFGPSYLSCRKELLLCVLKLAAIQAHCELSFEVPRDEYFPQPPRDTPCLYCLHCCYYCAGVATVKSSLAIAITKNNHV